MTHSHHPLYWLLSVEVMTENACLHATAQESYAHALDRVTCIPLCYSPVTGLRPSPSVDRSTSQMLIIVVAVLHVCSMNTVAFSLIYAAAWSVTAK